jgi:HEAT repeat protein
MSVGGIPGPGPFRGLVPFDENSAALFFGRADEIAALDRLVCKEGDRVVALTGELGVGKTSLLRAGLLPALAKHDVTGVYLGAYGDIEQEMWQAAGRVRGEPPTPGDGPADYLVRLARSSNAGTLLILDHLETILTPHDPGAGTSTLDQLAALLLTVTEGAGPRMRILLCVDTCSFHRLDLLYNACNLTPAAGAWMDLGRLDRESATQILEQTAVGTGTFFEAGLASLMAGDLCRNGSCLPADLQIVARMAVELRLTSLRRYERSGGAAILLHNFFQRAVHDAGGRPALRVLLAAARPASSTVEELATRAGLPMATVEQVVAPLVSRGILRKFPPESADRYAPAHPCLVARIEDFAASDVSAAHDIRRTLRRRILAGGRLSLPEIRRVRRYLGGDLASDEATTLKRSIRRSAVQIGSSITLLLAVLIALIFEVRTTYTLAFEPARDQPGSRVVVLRGRPSLAFLHFFSAHPRHGSMIADTGFAAGSVAGDLGSRIASGRALGSLDANRTARLPSWLRAVIDGLGPVPRGVSLVLLGEPNGVVSLKQAFADPASRRDALEALAVVGTGRAGEDEILAAALNDPSPDVRRRGVEVAAAIDRRQGKGAHAATLRAALADQSFAVRSAVLRECSSLDATTTASILSVALADKDASFRRQAETSLLDLAARSPAAAADAVRLALWSTDGMARRSAVGLLDQIAVRAPTEAATVLAQIASDESAPEEARVSALSFLRRTNTISNNLRPMLEKAVMPDASPRLRTVALPLYARLIDPAKVSELALAASKGPPSGRVTGAALWGVVAIKQPDMAAKPLKVFLYDPTPEVRVEAARGFGYLRREGPELVRKALLDPNAEVQKAALDSALRLAVAQPVVIADLLGHVLANVRPGLRRFIVEALGEIGKTRPPAVLPALVRALKQGDVNTRGACARALCVVAIKNPAAASPYLRVAARDANREVRTEAASCLGSLTEGDPKGAARMAIELTSSDEPTVRAAAAASLGALAGRVREIVLGPLINLLEDPERAVRMAAAEALIAYANTGSPLGSRTADLDKKLSGFFLQGDLEERQIALRVAAHTGLTSILRLAVRDGNDSLRLEAMKAAAGMQPPALEILQAGAEDRQGLVRAEAVRALAAASGSGPERVLPVFEAMLRASDPATRRMGALALGDVTGAPEATAALLAGVLHQRGESVRAAAAEALARIAQRDPKAAGPFLEQAIGDPAHDVRAAAIRGLGTTWARQRRPAEVAEILENSETDSARRLVGVEALVIQASQAGSGKAGEDAKQARSLLERLATSGPPLARLAAQVGRAFIGAKLEDMHAFFDRLYGG